MSRVKNIIIREHGTFFQSICYHLLLLFVVIVIRVVISFMSNKYNIFVCPLDCKLHRRCFYLLLYSQLSARWLAYNWSSISVCLMS
jgi:hypothetical protein